jgi:O-antigen biosynthesis protein
MLNLRKLAKSMVPNSLRDRMRDLVDGPGIEASVLRPYTYQAEDNPRPRLNLVLPSLSAKTAFGGIHTGLGFFSELCLALSAHVATDVRIICEAPYDPSDSALDGALFSGMPFSVLSLADSKGTVPTRKFDIYLVYNWWTSYNIAHVLEQQAKRHAYAQWPKLHLIQEFEPAFHPMSSAHLIALETLGSNRPMWSIYNSKLLMEYCQRLGVTGLRSYVFEPRLDKRLLAQHRLSQMANKKQRILVYGRPSIKRNCFSILMRGLENWARNSHHAQSWEVVSAGTKHKDIALADTVMLGSVGKLSYEQYGKLLSETALGISLMASPHPSYPPLEMAHFGVLTLANKYLTKDLSLVHQNITSLPDVRPETMAAEIDRLIEKFLADPTIGKKGQSHMPDFLTEKPFDCISALSQDLYAAIKERA